MLPLLQLPIAALQAHVFPALQNKALLSIGQFCDSNFTAVFHKGQVQSNRDDITSTGQREPSTGLYYINFPQPPPISPPALHPFACSSYEINTKEELFQYLHRCAFIPVVHTWTKAIDAGYFATWPGLISELVRKHLPKLIATAKGHLKQDGQNSIAPSHIVLPSHHEPPGRSHQVFSRQSN